MKKIVWILVVTTLMVGCGEARHPVLKEAAGIVHQHPDSARILISKVDTTLLSEADRTEYHLLKVMTDYIVCIGQMAIRSSRLASITTTSMATRGIVAGRIITGQVSEGICWVRRMRLSRITRRLRPLPRMLTTNC